LSSKELTTRIDYQSPECV